MAKWHEYPVGSFGEAMGRTLGWVVTLLATFFLAVFVGGWVGSDWISKMPPWIPVVFTVTAPVATFVFWIVGMVSESTRTRMILASTHFLLWAIAVASTASTFYASDG